MRSIIITRKKYKDFKPIGDIIKVKEIPRGVSLQFTNGKGKILIYSSKLIRFTITHKEFDLDYSYAVIKPLENWAECKYEIKDNLEKIEIITEDLYIEIIKTPFKSVIRQNSELNTILCEDIDDKMSVCYNIKNNCIRTYKNIREKAHFFGFGEKTGPLDKKGEFLIMDGRDLPYKGNSEPLYQNHPFFISISNGIAYGIFFDNISRTIFDMGKTNDSEYYFDAAKGDLNYYFIYGPNIDDILEIYTELTGRIEMPPKWAIGYHQCRYSYKNEKQIKEITSKFRKNNIPCDAIWFDIHYMDGYRCFTFNNKRFPNPNHLIQELKEKGFKSVVIVDPGIKIDEDYKIWQELIENKYYTPKKDGTPSVGLVWPGLTNFPDFTREKVREWWADKHKFYFDLGIDGIWNDMNEPALSINPILSWIKRLHSKDMYFYDQGRNTHHNNGKNVYALCEAWATWLAFKKYRPNRRPFILTRSGYSGVQRYAAIWTGDNWTNWYNITLAVRMLVNLNLSAQAFVGSDIGGFLGILKFIPKIFRDKKQFVRWIQSGVFYPFCRVHTSIATKSQDPFSYGKKVQEISKKYIKLRYELLPYWYNLFYECHKRGMPILRPLFYATPNDEKCFDKRFENQFFLGKDILIIPIAKRSLKNKLIYLPEGSWINYWTLKEYEGKKEHIIPITLEDIPIFVRKGAIIPTQPVIDYINQRPINTLILKIFKGIDGTENSISIYEDDGYSMDYKDKQMFCILNIKCKYENKESELILAKVQGNFKPSWKNINYVVYDQGKRFKEDTFQFSGNDTKIIF
ncbi:MAG: TIM-barrel domain-containing protein [Promethearchaeota archaeon]